jgi:ABC-type Fe3+/spermidine/putrescine transport system ATPase subunit
VAQVSTDALVLRRGPREIRCSGGADFRPGQQVLVSIRPEKLALQRERANGGLNVWEGRVASSAYYGDHREYEVELEGGDPLKVTTPARFAVEPGTQVFVACDPTEVVVMAVE